MTLTEIASDLDNIAAILSALLVIGGVWWGFVKWFLPLLKDVHLSFKQIGVIASEFQTNGGSSLRDAINRLEADTKHIHEDVMVIRGDNLKMEARQWAVVATLKDPIFESDSEGSCVRVNPSMLQLTERSMEELTGNNWENAVHPDDRARVWVEWMDAVEKQRTYEGLFRIKTTSGTTYQVSCVALPYFSVDDPNKPLGFIGRFESVKKLNPKVTQ